MKTLDEFKSMEEWNEYSWSLFLESIKRPDLKKFFDLVITDLEKEKIVKRFFVSRLLKVWKLLE